MQETQEHDWGFFVWALCGFLLSFGFLAIFTIGLPILVVGFVFFLVLLWQGPVWPADLGLFAGVGAALTLIAAINVASGDSPGWWAIAGSSLILASSAAFWFLRCRPARPAA